ncbi:MAG: OsmC family protein [Spirochaetales bacterium]|nr:OsmC family protein [Spirochaetales bacterium]MCF7938760.1 OsmC family protein [Spirochaetales bacterium]
MSYTTRIDWKGGMAFDGELQGHPFKIDAAENHGGKNYGPTPKPMMLSSLAGCTAMDTVALLDKFKVSFDSFAVEVDGDLAEEHPKVYTNIRVKFIFSGKNLEDSRKKIEKAINLSQERYCGVAAMVRNTAEINIEVVLNES